MKNFNTSIKFLTLLMAFFCINFSACQKEAESNDLTIDVVGEYNGEYREGEGGFTVIVGNVVATVTKNSDSAFAMKMELVTGLVIVNFTADMQDKNNFTINSFELDGDTLEGNGTLDGSLLEISFYEEGTQKQYATYIAEKQ